MKKTSTPSARTAGQETKYRRLVEDSTKHSIDLALSKTDADQKGWQRVLEHGDEMRDAIAEIVVAKTRELSMSNQFANEEAESNYGYLSGYTKSKDLIWQTNRLRELIPGVGYACEDIPRRLALPADAEGWFAIPKWQTLAKTYPEAVQKVLDLIKKIRGKLYNWREGQIDPQHIRQSQRTTKMLHAICDQQKDYDILVLPCQFGIRHRGHSVRRALEVMSVREFGLDTFSIGIMLLTHPERLQHYDDLWIDCAGDEFSDDGDGRFGRAPYFYFDDDRVRFGTNDVDYPLGHYGSASFFAPQ